MGLGDYKGQGNGNGVKFLNIAGGAVWDKSGNDKEHAFYHEESFDVAGDTKTRKGYRYGSVSGTVESASFKEGKFGESLNTYIRDAEADDLFCLQVDMKGGFGKYNVMKKVMIGLMSADLDLPLTINVKLTDVSDTFSFDDIWISQQGKNLVLNHLANDDFFDPEKQIAMPIEVKTLLGEVSWVSKEEMKAIISPDKKARKRLGELEQIQTIFNAWVGDRLKFDGKKEAAPTAQAPTATEPTAQAEAETQAEPTEAAPQAEPAKALSPKERIKQMREEQAAKKAAQAN